MNPSREESVQHTDTAVHERLCVAMALYLRGGMKECERGLFLHKSKHVIHMAFAPLNRCVRVQTSPEWYV